MHYLKWAGNIAAICSFLSLHFEYAMFNLQGCFGNLNVALAHLLA